LEKLLLQNKRLLNGHFACITLLCAVLGLHAQTGGQAGAYLRAPVGAQATAMGGSRSALPEYFSAWWNPSQLSFNDKKILSLGTGLYSLGRTEAFASFDFKVPPRVGLGIGALYRGDPFIDNLYSYSETKLPSASFTSLTVKGAFSYLITRQWSAGLSLGFFYQRLPTGYSEINTEAGTIASLYYSEATAVSGFSFGTQYKVTDSLTLAFVVRDINPLQMLTGAPAGIAMDWQLFTQDNYNPTVTDMVLPVFVFASAYHGGFFEKPLLWTLDINAYVLDGTFTKLDYMEARVFTGFELRQWPTFCIRAGLGDITLNRDIASDWHFYSQNFLFRLTAGFGWDLAKVRKGLTLNYALTTDKVWAGIDQKLDVVYKF
jgi:hypothetical protein